jgi:NAD(P)-dependent dehydrogenase (short-subunit alcohol dehydrogenase family)
VFLEFFNITEEDIPGLGERFSIPLGRVGTPEDIATAAIYLASPASSWMTGETIEINGGL